jgi:tetratricopeptide (TPR) repeat protein
VRGRIQRFYKKREVSVVGEYNMEQMLERSSIEVRDIDSLMVRQLARQMRADEVINGVVERNGTKVRVNAWLALTRDRHLIQHLPTIEAPTPDSAGALVAAGIEKFRRQLNPLRRCENGMREGRMEATIAETKQVANTLPTPALLRSCLVSAYVMTGVNSREVLAEANKILEVEPTSFWGLDAAARAYDALEDRPKAAEMWLRLAASEPGDLELSRRVLTALIRGENAAAAKPLVVSLSDANPDLVDLRRQRWQVFSTLREWKEATAVGDRLAAEDTASSGDSTFIFRLATAHRALGDTIKAVAVAAGGVTRFPKDARLYLLYSDLVQADSRVAIDRGIARFPEVAELHLLRAQELRRAGKNAEALGGFQKALELDPTSGQGVLALAQTQVDLGMLDSALVTTRKAVDAGESRSTVAAFALARGNAIYRAANSTKQRTDYQLALQFLSLADSLQGSPQSRFLLGATALSISQSAATDAPGAKACDLSRLANAMLPLAREKITAGAVVAPDAATQYLAYLDQLEPVVAQQVATLCTG